MEDVPVTLLSLRLRAPCAQDHGSVYWKMNEQPVDAAEYSHGDCSGGS